MTTRAVPPVVDEYSEYPMHEEENVPESDAHEWTVRYLRNVLGILFPDWYCSGNLCIYWQKGNKKRYVAPDAFVVRHSLARKRRKNYLLWLDPPVSFVAEVASDRTRHIDLGTKLETYSQKIQAPEYLFIDPPDEERPARAMRLWRLGRAGYEEVLPDANGRLRSETLGLEFGWDDQEQFRVYADGVPQRTPEEAETELAEEARRRQDAEARAGAELLRREEAETARREAEARAAAEAEQRAAEAARREEAESRAADLERQLAELRAQLGKQSSS
jgi:Uma2 family endonuclease